jgi:hypothetical protein
MNIVDDITIKGLSELSGVLRTAAAVSDAAQACYMKGDARSGDDAVGNLAEVISKGPPILAALSERIGELAKAGDA